MFRHVIHGSGSISVKELRMKLRYGVLALLFMLSGCANGPSADDIKAALQRALTFLMGSGKVTVEAVSNVDCKEAQGKPGYVCSYSATTFNKLLNQRGTSASEGRFVKDGDNWNLMQN